MARRRARAAPRRAAAAAVALLLLCCCCGAGLARAAAVSSTTTTSGNGQASSTFSSSTSVKGPGQGPAVATASASNTSGGGGPGAGGALPSPGQCVVASQSEGQACADGLCCQVQQELRLCMPSWAKMDGSAPPPPPIPRAFAAVAGGPPVPCCVLLADAKRGGALVPFCAADPSAFGGAAGNDAKGGAGGFFPLPSGAVVTKMTPSCAAGPKAPGGFKYGTVACSVAFPPGSLPEGFSAPAGDYSSAKAPLVADVSGKAAPCSAARGGYGRLLQVATWVPSGSEGPNGEPAGSLRVTSKCE